jgi:hypothetical protein
MRVVTATLLGILLYATPTFAAGPELVSMIKLIASPKSYDGKQVMVTGVPRIQFEGQALYLHKEDYDAGLAPNALWLTVPREKYAEWKSLEGRYVRVVGTFRAAEKGHLSAYSGGLREITTFEVLPLVQEAR